MKLDNKTLKQLAHEHGTPLFVYSKGYLKQRAETLAGLSLPYGYVPRYAAKANTHPEIIRSFAEAGLSFDVSSSHEAMELINQGINPRTLSLSSQQPAHNLSELVELGVEYVATSMHQLALFADVVQPGAKLGLRINPGLGAGHNNRTTTGGANSSFGLWYAYLPDALKFAAEHDLHITKLHIHIGSGADPKMWETVIETALEIVRDMPEVTTLNIGGGFKISRFADEHEADMVAIGKVFADDLRRFAKDTKREIAFEVEPGTWLVGHAGVLLAEIADMADTGPDGHTFLRLNTGMNDIIRPAMYGAQHEIDVLSDSDEQQSYVVVGHNCETGDILTPAPGDPEGIESREMNTAAIGDIVVIRDAGAYCASMSVKGYNSFPPADEIVI